MAFAARVAAATSPRASTSGRTSGRFARRASTPARLGTTPTRGARDADAGADAPSCACRKCRDTGRCDCKDCNASGFLPPGGYHLKNVVDMKNAVGTRWTAHKRTRGWRHFECVGASPKAKTLTLRATCDTSVTVDIPVKFLKDRMEWSAGWKQREELDWVGDVDAPGGAVAYPKGRTTCAKCQGVGTLPCEAKGCREGLVKIEKQRAVIEKTEKIFRRQLEALRENDDEESKRRSAAIKKQLNTKSQMKKERARELADRERAEKLTSSDSGDGWSAYRNARRDEDLERWLAGAAVERDPDEQQ